MPSNSATASAAPTNSSRDFTDAKRLRFTDNLNDIADSNVYTVTAPTLVGEHKLQRLPPLENASVTAGRLPNLGDAVSFEFITYLGFTEGVCIALLEHTLDLTYNRHWVLGRARLAADAFSGMAGDCEAVQASGARLYSGERPVCT